MKNTQRTWCRRVSYEIKSHAIRSMNTEQQPVSNPIRSIWAIVLFIVQRASTRPNFHYPNDKDPEFVWRKNLFFLFSRGFYFLYICVVGCPLTKCCAWVVRSHDVMEWYTHFQLPSSAQNIIANAFLSFSLVLVLFILDFSVRRLFLFSASFIPACPIFGQIHRHSYFSTFDPIISITLSQEMFCPSLKMAK